MKHGTNFPEWKGPYPPMSAVKQPGSARPITIADLQESALSIAINTGRFDAFEPFDSHVAHLHCEVAEIGQAYRDRRLDAWTGTDGKPEGVAAELADVVILAASLAGFYQIDLASATRAKMEFNRTRREAAKGEKA